MGLWNYLFIVGLLCVCSHDRVEEKAYKETEGAGKANFVATQNWVDLATPQRIAHLRRLLALHHSADRRYLKKLVIMEKRMDKEPWRCKPCKRLNKASTGYCGQCGSPWEQCWDRSYSHPSSRNYAEEVGLNANWQHWDNGWAGSSWDQRPRSPRRRSSKSPTSTRKGGKGESQTGKNQSQDMKWPSPVLDYSKIKDGRKPTVVPPRVTNVKPAETSPEVQDLIQALQASYPDGLPQEVQLRVDKLKRTTTMDLKKHIGQLTKVKKDLDSMRAARVRHKDAWKRHVQSLVENTKAQLQQYQSVMANFETCEAELVQAFDGARKAIMEITQQSTPAEEDVKAIKALDSGLLAGGPDAPIEIEEGNEDEEMIPDADATVITQLQCTLSECVNSLADARDTDSSLRPRSRSRQRNGEKDGTGTKGGGKQPDL